MAVIRLAAEYVPERSVEAVAKLLSRCDDLRIAPSTEDAVPMCRRYDAFRKLAAELDMIAAPRPFDFLHALQACIDDAQLEALEPVFNEVVGQRPPVGVPDGVVEDQGRDFHASGAVRSGFLERQASDDPGMSIVCAIVARIFGVAARILHLHVRGCTASALEDREASRSRIWPPSSTGSFDAEAVGRLDAVQCSKVVSYDHLPDLCIAVDPGLSLQN